MLQPCEFEGAWVTIVTRMTCGPMNQIAQMDLDLGGIEREFELSIKFEVRN